MAEPKYITCVAAGVHSDAIKVGKKYEMLAHDLIKKLVRIKGDHGRIRRFGAAYFDLEGRDFPTLVDWRFDECAFDPTSGNVDISLTMSDGSSRWLTAFTPSNAEWLLTKNHPQKSLYGTHMMIVKRLDRETIDAALRDMQCSGDLVRHSVGIETDDT